jgi:hypothetical protein
MVGPSTDCCRSSRECFAQSLCTAKPCIQICDQAAGWVGFSGSSFKARGKWFLELYARDLTTSSSRPSLESAKS